MKNILFLSVFIFSINSFSQSNNKSSLVLSEIMKGNEYIGFQPENAYWSLDSRYIFFNWNPDKNPGNSLYAFSLESKKTAKVTKEFLLKNFEFDKKQKGFSFVYYILDGALVQYNSKDKSIAIVYQTTAQIHSLQRITNSENAYFISDNNLYCYNEKSKGIQQLTNFIQKENEIEQHDSTYLERQQVELFKYVRNENTKNAWDKKEEITLFQFPKEQFLGKEAIENIQLSNDAKFILFRLGQYDDGTETLIENHVTNDGFSKITSARPKVNENENHFKLGIYNRSKDTIQYVDFSILSDIRKKPLYLNDPKPFEKDRAIVINEAIFSKNGSTAVIDVRSQDNKDRWIVLLNCETGKITEIEKQHDEAWIGGPGISSWDYDYGTLGWLNNETIYFQSEETGYSHLYTLNVHSKKKNALTAGKWEVYSAELSKDASKFFISANKTHPGNRDFYHLSLKDHKLIPILSKDGFHEVSVSPDEKTLAVRYSFKNKPWEIYYCKNESASELIQITQSISKEFKNYSWITPEVITYKGSDGKDVYARVFKPTIENKNKSAVLFVHGAGYLQNAHNYWSYYCREYMFHNLLVDNGYTVIDVDYRASEGYGRDYRTAIYENMGGRDLEDYIDARSLLINQYGIDSNKIGIYGGSYGGFITLMGMLKTPGKFKCGAALRSVTDWAHYNHEYTNNILNTPETDPIAFKKSSPIYYANNLQGRLLMLHGMVDDNVQFQDIIRLSQRFIELGKTNWELAVFPIETHSFKESYSWTDEFRRIYELFEEELK